MRFSAVFLIASACALTAACGPTIFEHGVDGDSTSGNGASGAGANGAGASGAGASGNGASGTGANGTGASGTGASGTGASGTGASGAGGPGEPQWAEAFGEEGHQHLQALATDAQHDVILGGYFDGTLKFGGGPLAQKGLRSGFVAKLDMSGKPAWGRSLNAENCAVTSLAVDGAGAIYLTGFVKGTLHFEGQTVASSDGILVAKLDPDGHLTWARTFGSSAGMQADRGLSVSIVPNGVLVGGAYAAPLDLGGGPIGPGGAFIVVLDPGGATLWSHGFDGTAAFVGGDAGVQGFTVGINTASGMSVQTFGAGDGTLLWKHDYSPGSLAAVAIDPSGNVLLAGSSTGADFGGGPIPSPLPNGEGFLVGLDATGNHRFTRGLPFDTSQSTATALTIAPNGGAAVTGNFVHHVDTSTVVKSAFLVTVDASGKTLKNLKFGPSDGLGSSVTQQGWGVAPGPKPGSFYLAGDFFTQIDIAATSLTGDGTSDIFVARLPP